MSTLMAKKSMKRKLEEEEACRRKKHRDPQDNSAPCNSTKTDVVPTSDSEDISNRQSRRVQFGSNLLQVIPIDGVDSESLQSYRKDIWYSRSDYRSFFKDRVDTVRIWRSLDSEDINGLLSNHFTIRGLETYVVPEEETDDPYVQTVLQAQKRGIYTAELVHQKVKDYTKASLEKAQKLAAQDAIDATSSDRQHSIYSKRRLTPPRSPSSIIEQFAPQEIDSDMEKLKTIQERRNSMSLYRQQQQKEEIVKAQRRTSLNLLRCQREQEEQLKEMEAMMQRRNSMSLYKKHQNDIHKHPTIEDRHNSFSKYHCHHAMRGNDHYCQPHDYYPAMHGKHRDSLALGGQQIPHAHRRGSMYATGSGATRRGSLVGAYQATIPSVRRDSLAMHGHQTHHARRRGSMYASGGMRRASLVGAYETKLPTLRQPQEHS